MRKLPIDLTKSLCNLKELLDIDGKGCYYTWDEFRYRMKPKEAEQLWLYLKVARSLSSQRFPYPPVGIRSLIVGIVLHFLIRYIHPFYDGNWRTVRTLFYWYVLLRGYLLFEYISISNIITQAPARYLGA